MKFNQVIAVVAAMFFAIFSCGIARTQADMRYSQIFEVIEIDDDVIYLIDNNGNEWVWEGAKDWEIGDYAAATMDTNGTEIIYDDIIVNLRYTRIAER